MTSQVLIRREPVISRHKAIIATRLVIHTDHCAKAAETLRQFDDIWPPARSIMLALDGCLPTSELLAWQPPANVMIEIPASALGQEETLALMTRLHSMGTALCLSAYDGRSTLPEVPFRFLLADFGVQGKLDNPPALPLALRLDDPAAFEDAIAAGYAGATGWFFLHGKPAWGPLQTNHAQAVRVLNLVRKNAEVTEIEAALKLDVTLSFKLLKYINSAAFGVSKEIQSFRHAVTLLGYDKLNKWLSLLLVTASKSPIAPALMQTAIARGRFMETAGADRFDARQRDNLFITGAFSLLDILLGAQMADILTEMQLPPEIRDALGSGTGPFAPYLNLALACENTDPVGLTTLATQLDLPVATINYAQLEALAFADNLQID